MQDRSGIINKLKEIPGVVLYFPWLSMYLVICWITRKLAKRSSARAPTEFTPEEYAEMKGLWVTGAACFAIVVLVQSSHIIFQISAKKRMLGSNVFFITSVACTTYVAQSQDIIMPVIMRDGRELQLARYLEWMSTTVMMVLTIHATGNNRNKALVKDWKETIMALVYDEVMLVTGLLHW